MPQRRRSRLTLFGRRRAPDNVPGAAFVGSLWAGGSAEIYRDSVVLVDPAGRIDRMGPARLVDIPDGVPIYGGPGYWIGPGIVDAHVHLALTDPPDVATGLVAVRDLGAPPAVARAVRTGHQRPTGRAPFVAAAGQIVTAPRGYPSQSWGSAGYAAFAGNRAQARTVVQGLAAAGSDVIKLALEPGTAGWPVLNPGTVRTVVDAAHSAGLAVVAHALRADMVRRAVEARVDEFAHTPTERLPQDLIATIADRGIGVVSTLQTFFSSGTGSAAAANAADLVQAGATLRYGTDLGNTGTRPGVDPRELDRLADTGLGRLGALRAATIESAAAPGMRTRTGRLSPGEPAALVLLPGDPLSEPGLWRTASAVVADARILAVDPPRPKHVVFATMDDVRSPR